MKRLMIIIGLILVMCLLIPVACGKASVPEPIPAPSPAPAPAPMPPPGSAQAPSPAIMIDEGTSIPGAEERIIVRTGEISLIVADVIDTRDEIASITVNRNGYVVSSRIQGEEQDMRGWIAIRVPDEEFDAMFAELRSLATRVDSESTSSRDVTEEYIDLESRLGNAEATEQQYLALLPEAEGVEDILRIYESLSRVRQDIESIKGRIQYLERTSSMSLIDVRLEPEATAKALVQAGWSVAEILKSAVRGIVTFGQWLGTIAIWLLIFSPIWGTVLGIILWRRHRKRKAAA
ncbi:DUF4349 domain-containing protein [Chloroflexota bacterium]